MVEHKEPEKEPNVLPTMQSTEPELQEGVASTTARKLTFSAASTGVKDPEQEQQFSKPLSLKEILLGNCSFQQGKKLDYFPPIVKDGVKIVRLNPTEVREQREKWEGAFIGYVVGGNPLFKDMLRYVYGVWNFVETPQVYLHADGYFIYHFESEEEKNMVLDSGPYTYNSRPLVEGHQTNIEAQLPDKAASPDQALAAPTTQEVEKMKQRWKGKMHQAQPDKPGPQANTTTVEEYIEHNRKKALTIPGCAENEKETARGINEPWVVLGDFNTVLSVHDGINGQPVHTHETTDFQSYIEDIGLGQLTRRGCQYSRSNKRDANPECADL
ncbi:hypothetical protein RND71_022819 [Anisodus tanguticus]|uniref:DUF4283 domain-containing protein n=1 Tax=Anisodus tanguticus TaxID=243964 RepID=A0AAE1RRH4_9SOLA|nr:hypothetical protein RND71_022819 [Anisodus tanguticus]